MGKKSRKNNQQKTQIVFDENERAYVFLNLIHF
jgi:hypothetical protein